MNIRITIEGVDRRDIDALLNIPNQLERNERLLRRILDKENQQMASTQQLLAAVSAQTTVIASVGEFISTLKAELLAQGVAQADIDAAFEGVNANTTTAALFVNTPTPAPEPVPEP